MSFLLRPGQKKTTKLLNFMTKRQILKKDFPKLYANIFVYLDNFRISLLLYFYTYISLSLTHYYITYKAGCLMRPKEREREKRERERVKIMEFPYEICGFFLLQMCIISSSFFFSLLAFISIGRSYTRISLKNIWNFLLTRKKNIWITICVEIPDRYVHTFDFIMLGKMFLWIIISLFMFISY